MIPAEFKTKWAKFSGKESAAYQEHFTDLCRMLRVEPAMPRRLALKALVEGESLNSYCAKTLAKA